MPRAMVTAAKKRPTRKSAVGRLRGRGDYTYDKPGPWGKFGRRVGQVIGGVAGGAQGMLAGAPWAAGGYPLAMSYGRALGAAAGSAAGGKAGSYLHYIGKIFGSGDYVTSAGSVKQNTLVNNSQIPSFASSKNEVRIRHREFLTDISTHPTTAGAFNLQSFPINPGVRASFPWLAEVCGSTFQQYRINGMVFEYRSSSSNALNSTNTALGVVVMATDYDSADSVFTSKQQMENTEFGVSCKPSSNMIHGIECAKSLTSISELYVRAFDVPSGKDPRVYDMGNFQIATVGGQAAAVTVGELWVSYDISLIKAIEQVPGFIMPMANYSPVSASGTAPLGTSIAISALGIDTIGLTFTENRIYFPYNTPLGATFSFQYAITTASAALTMPAVTYNNGFTDLATYHAPSAGATSTYGLITGLFRLTTAATQAALPYVNLADYTTGAISYCQLNVQQVSGVPQVP